MRDQANWKTRARIDDLCSAIYAGHLVGSHMNFNTQQKYPS